MVTGVIGNPGIYGITGLRPSYTYSLNKILWYKNNRPGIYNDTFKFILMEEIFNKLLGFKATPVSYSAGCRTMFFNINKKDWSGKILEKLDIDPGKFSKPVPSGTMIGTITKKVKEELDFKSSGEVFVVVGGHDQPCASLGSGSIEEDMAANSAGTVECITPVIPGIRLDDSIYKNSFCCESHVVNDLYITFAYNISAGSLIEWYKNSIGFKDSIDSGKINKDFYNYIYEGFDFKPSGIHVLPYFGPSATPFFHEKPLGSILGLDTNTSTKDIFKAIIEGLVFEIKFNIELLKDSQIKIGELRATGGGSRSDYWMQLKANILNKKVLRMNVDEAGCMGAAMLAAVAGSVFKDHREAVDSFVKVDKEFHPVKQNQDLYLEKYEKYKKLFNLARSII